MATTTNFGWTTPDNTALVKDGASAIRTLGSSIDTSFVDLKGGTTGQVLKKTSGTDLDFEWGSASGGLSLISTTTMSSVTNQSFNNVFTSTYNNYKIVVNDLVTSGGFVTFRLRASSTDDSSSNYRYRSYRGAVSGPGGDDTSQYSSSTTSFQTVYTLTSPDTAGFSADVFAPQLAKQTQLTVLGFDAPSSGYVVISGGRFAATTQFDGFSLLGSSMSGVVSIYGYAK